MHSQVRPACPTVFPETDVDFPALVFYDYVITVPQEVRVVWQRSLTIPEALLILNRYIIVFNAILSVLIDLTWGDSVRSIHKVHRVRRF